MGDDLVEKLSAQRDDLVLFSGEAVNTDTVNKDDLWSKIYGTKSPLQAIEESSVYNETEKSVRDGANVFMGCAVKDDDAPDMSTFLDGYDTKHFPGAFAPYKTPG